MATKESPASGEPAEKGVVSQEARNSGRNSIALDPPPLESVRVAPVDDIAKSLAADMDVDADVAEAYNDGRTLEEILEGYTTEEAQKKAGQVWVQRGPHHGGARVEENLVEVRKRRKKRRDVNMKNRVRV